MTLCFMLNTLDRERCCSATSKILFSHNPSFFFFNDTATTEIYTLSLHDALPITEAAELGRLVDDLLLTSRLESGGLPARSDLLDLCALVDAAAQRARPRLDLVGGQLEIALPMGPVRISGDPEQLSRILDNLLNNALTYRRPTQPAWVRLQVVVVDQLAMVAVEDRGRGVPVEMRERIFERFVRADESSDSMSGTGLGLYISR